MADVVSKIAKELSPPHLEPALEVAGHLIADLVEEDAYVGDVYSLSYADALSTTTTALMWGVSQGSDSGASKQS